MSVILGFNPDSQYKLRLTDGGSWAPPKSRTARFTAPRTCSTASNRHGTARSRNLPRA